MLKLKLQYFGHLIGRVDTLEKTLMLGRLGAGGEGDDRGWDGWMASPTWRTWVWVNSGNWCWTGKPGVLQFMGSQRVVHDWATELNWTDCFTDYAKFFCCVDHNIMWKFFKCWEYQTTLPPSCKTCMQVNKQQLEPDMEQWTVKIGKGVCQGCILSVCLSDMQSTSCRTLGWMKYKSTIMAEREEELNSPVINVKEKS